MKTHFKSCSKQPKTAPIYRPQKYSRWGPTQQETLLSVNRPVDRQRSDFRPLGKAVDRSVDQKLGYDLAFYRPVDRSHLQREEALWRSTVRSTGPWPCTFVHVSRLTSGSVDRAVDQQKARNRFLRI